jgi:hypothetical protein
MRITDKVLNSFVDSINSKTGNNLASWTKTENDSKTNIGNYHLNYYNGFVGLDQMTSEGGAVTNICSPCTNRELYYFMRGFLEGAAY